ncbi:MAG TPA: hypothetical protein VEL03_09425 [Streptosporangiaceae bacterium]|nr:hypothetical protein [Streptosporangiaceae bacterium]
MDATLLAALNDAERLVVAETERDSLAALDEDAAIELEGRIRRARNKYVGQYRRAAAARVAEQGGRGKARPENKRARLRSEAFETALSRVSRQVALLARRSAAELRAERLAAARSKPRRPGPAAKAAVPAQRRQTPVDRPPAGDRALRSPRTEKQRAGALAQGARWQAKRDSR